MAPTHLKVAKVNAAGIAAHVKGIQERLGEIYLILSRDLTEEARTAALDHLHQAMADTRSLVERGDLMDLTVRGIESDIDAALATLSNTIKGKAENITSEKATPTYTRSTED